MLQNEHDAPPPAAGRLSETLAPILGVALGALMLLAIGGYALHSWSASSGYGDCYPQDDDNQAPHEYAKWEKPLLAFTLSGQMHGYIDPCGCSRPQHGGLPRRYNFIQSLKAKGWETLGIDLGEMAHNKGIPEQDKLRFELTVKSLAKMNYRAFGIGKNEILLPLGEALTQIWDQKNPFPRPISLSLANKQYAQLNWRPYEIIGDTTPKIGVVSVIGPDLRDALPQEKYANNMTELPKALKAFADAGVEFGIILQHEHPRLDPQKFPPGGIQRMQKIEEIRTKQALDCAEFCAAERKKNPRVPPIYLILSLVEDPEPSSAMRPVDPQGKLPTQTVEVGHKGKYVGLLGVYRGKNGYRLQYDLVKMSPEWETKEADKKGHAVINLFENYTREVKNQDLLAKFPRSPHFNQLPPPNQKGLKATYVGSSRCGECHDDAYKVWRQKSKTGYGHGFATERLAHEKFPSNRHFDPECMKCHTTGMAHPGGYNDLIVGLANWPAKPAKAPAAKKVKQHNDDLRGVGCESCHGPGSEHVKNPDDKTLYPLINPFAISPEERILEAKGKNRTPPEDKRYKELFNPRMSAMNGFCMKCHDAENDVHWGNPGHTVVDRWIGGKIVHRMPNRKVAPAPPVKKGAGPTIINQPPPLVIEVIEDKKK